MKKSMLAALAIVALASCSKENTANDTTDVVAKFTAASITRVADNKWEADDQIGISMVETTTTTLADGNYENVPYTVNAAGESGTFSPTTVVSPAVAETIYFPVDGSKVDFYAYYPYSEVDDDKNISVSVADQEYAHIDLLAAKATGYDKDNATVKFANNATAGTYEAFTHQLSKLTLTIKKGDGIDDLTGLKTTIKGQNTTAKFNIYTGVFSGINNVTNITAVTSADGTKAEAILLPTAAIAGSTIVFTLGTDDYIWETKDLVLTQGSEHNYEITITKTGITASGATINNWGDGTDGTGTAE